MPLLSSANQAPIWGRAHSRRLPSCMSPRFVPLMTQRAPSGGVQSGERFSVA